MSQLSASKSLADVCTELPWLPGALASVGILSSVEVESMSGAGGLNAEMSRLRVTFEDSR